MRAPEARRMKSGAAPTLLNARTGLSTPPGRICWARVKSRRDRLVFMADGYWMIADRAGLSFQLSALSRSPDRLSDFNRGEIADGHAQKLLLVLVVRAAARGVERARGAVEIALQQEHRRDAERG